MNSIKNIYLFIYLFYLCINFFFFLDFISYYTLPSTVMHHPTYKTLKAAYSFYNVSTNTPWKTLMKDALVTAKNVSINFALKVLLYPIDVCLLLCVEF